jgi:hypothetical protein
MTADYNKGSCGLLRGIVKNYKNPENAQYPIQDSK